MWVLYRLWVRVSTAVLDVSPADEGSGHVPWAHCVPSAAWAARREAFPSRFKAEPRRSARKQVSMGPVLGWRPRGQGAGRAPGCRLCEESMVSPWATSRSAVRRELFQGQSRL